MSNKILIFCTMPTAGEAESLAEILVNEQLAACVNILPAVLSVYRWQGAVERSPEVLMVIKSQEGLFEALKNRIVSAHPYDVPEVIAVPVSAGHLPYLEWIDSSTKQV